MSFYDNIDHYIVAHLKRWGLPALRYSVAIVFIWFGILKPMGLSPAADLVAATVYWVSPDWFVPFLGWWEVAIGLCLLWKPCIRIGLLLMAVQMIGTFLPLILLPNVVYGQTFGSLTLHGQYIIKNIVLLSAAMVVGSHVRDDGD